MEKIGTTGTCILLPSAMLWGMRLLIFWNIVKFLIEIKQDMKLIFMLLGVWDHPRSCLALAPPHLALESTLNVNFEKLGTKTKV